MRVGVRPGEMLRISLVICRVCGVKREKMNFVHSDCSPALRQTFWAVVITAVFFFVVV